MRQCVALALVLAACSPAPADPTPDAGTKFTKKLVRVAGTVRLHDHELAWRTANDKDPPSFDGLSIDVEDALKATTGQPPLKSTTVAADGTWALDDVDVTDVTLAVVALVKDPTNVLAPSGYGLVRGRPDGDLIDKPVYVFSREYLAHLVAPTGLTADDLLAEGFIVMEVTDRDGRPLAGAQVARMSPTAKPIESSEDNPLWYLNADLTGLNDEEVTSASGVAIFLPGFGAKEYSAIKDGLEFEVKLSGAREGVVLSTHLPAR